MTNLIHTRIDKGELPNVPSVSNCAKRVPEDQILEYCKKYNPSLVVMGTHGKKVSTELIGSKLPK